MVTEVQTGTQTTRKRVKTGCLNCRERHKKCDETKPICGLCTKRKEGCQWPSSGAKVTNKSFRIVKVGKEDDDGDGKLSLRKYSSRLLEALDDKNEHKKVHGSTSPRLQNLINLGEEAKRDQIEFNDRETTQSNLDINPGQTMDIQAGLSLNSPLTDALTRPPLSHSPLVPKMDIYPPIITEDPTHNDDTHSHHSSTHHSIHNHTSTSTNHVRNGSTASNEVPGSSTNGRTPNEQSQSSEAESISPDSLMPPFLDYSHLHRTFRDYMFTNIASSTTVPNDDLLDVNFKNILESPVPDFLNHKNSSKNLQDLLDDKELYNLIPPSSFDVNGDTTVEGPVEISDDDKLRLYKIYLYEIAPWLDMFDKTKQFGSTVPYLASSNPVLLNAIYAIASRQLEQTHDDYPHQKTIKLYQDILKHLIPTVNKTMDSPLITSCVILCVFEMMSSSPKKWRYHLEGCAALFKSHRITGFSNDLERGLFWCYARMDVNSAVIGEQSTIIPSEKWLPPDCSIYDSKKIFTQFGDKEDMYANYMVYLCSRVLNLIAKAQLDYDKEWKFLWDEITEWHTNRPPQLMPVLTQNKYSTALFPGIVFVNGPAISSNQLYHMAIILMIQNKPRLHKIIYSDHIRSPVWHAKQIVAISLHNEHHGCWNNALQPLWIAGQLLSSEQEHEVILNLLGKIEGSTGWQMNFRAKDLRKHWNVGQS